MNDTVGRIVHVYADDFETEDQIHGGPIAAIITEVLPDDKAYLCIFPPRQLPGYPRNAVPYSDTPKAGCWTWPPRD